MENKTMVEQQTMIEQIMSECKIKLVSLDNEKIIGHLENGKSIVFIYFNSRRVIEKSVIGIDKTENMPIISSESKDYIYNDTKALIDLLKIIQN